MPIFRRTQAPYFYSFKLSNVFPLGKIGEDVEHIRQSFTIGGNGNYYRHFGKHQVRKRPTYKLAVPVLGMFLIEMPVVLSHHTHICIVHTSVCIVHTSVCIVGVIQIHLNRIGMSMSYSS